MLIGHTLHHRSTQYVQYSQIFQGKLFQTPNRAFISFDFFNLPYWYRANIHYDLLRTGSVEATVHRLMERGYLDAVRTVVAGVTVGSVH
jgi:hypothetical protein